MSIGLLVIGIIGLIGTIISLAISIVRIPDHLTGYYGLMYGILAVFGFGPSISMIIIGTLGI